MEDTNIISYTSKFLSSSFFLLSCIKLQSISSQHAPLSGKRCSDLSSWLRQEDQYDVEYLIILITRPHNIMIFVFSFSLFFLNYIMFSYRLLYCLNMAVLCMRASYPCFPHMSIHFISMANIEHSFSNPSAKRQ